MIYFACSTTLSFTCWVLVLLQSSAVFSVGSALFHAVGTKEDLESPDLSPLRRLYFPALPVETIECDILIF